jgi:N-acetylglutamate synthase-like GNAT family acetyltransferase
VTGRRSAKSPKDISSWIQSSINKAEAMKSTPELRETNDFSAMLSLAREAGLDSDHLTGIVSAYGFYLDGKMVGCAALKKGDDLFMVECLAVAESMRGRSLGRTLVAQIEKEAAANGARKIWAIARQPTFFERIGYRISSASDPGAPKNDDCVTCPQFGKSCRPAIVVKDL